MPGPRPKPTALKLIAGSKRINKHEPQPSGELYAPPVHLSDAEQEVWRQTIEDAPPGLLKNLDVEVMVTFVQAVVTRREAVKKLRETGLLVKSPVKGDPMQNPYLAIVNKQAQMILKAAAELGFSPSSRSRVSIDEIEEDENPFAKFRRA